MVSLARSTLIYEWKRYLAAVLAVAFSGLLVLVQIGLLLGQFGTVTAIVDLAQADLWVIAPNTESFDLAREMPSRLEMRLRMHPEVETVQQMISGFGDWRTRDGGKVTVYVWGLDTDPDSLSWPRSLDPALREQLRETGGVIIDVVDVNKLRANIGEISEINNKRVRVVGLMEGFRAIGGANIMSSMATARELEGQYLDSDYAQYFLVKLHDSSRAAQVRDQLQPTGSNPPYRVMTPEELSAMSQAYWLLESGSGISFGFSAVLALIVGVAITSQTLRGTILAALREYATLRALGVSLKSLRAIVLEQAFWVGVVGLIVTGALTCAIYLTARASYVAIAFPWWTIVSASVFTIAVALLSGFLSLQPLYKTEPAELLR